jgi:uncharacterized protein YggU (UPF0235/DUF167 family)
VDGAANEVLLRLLAGALDVPRSYLGLVSSASNRRKLIGVEGLDVVSLQARWPGLDV